jgi:membrane-bound lytic murein transglycosylase
LNVRDAASAREAAAALRLEDFRDRGEPASLLEAVALTRKALARRASRERSGLEMLETILRAKNGSLGESLGARFRARAPVTVLLTGYYEPTLPARAARDERFRFPVLAPPPGAGSLPTRAQIDGGALERQGLELFWLDDPIEAFFLHVQGSGRLALEDGSIVRIGYAANNGWAYRSI